ncbi:MAG: hypothetical protein ACXWC0_08980, partial [Burkholderiales bacterium]
MSWQWTLIVGVALLVGVLIGRSTGRRVRRRKLDVLENAAQRWSDGDYRTRIGLTGKSALARL